MLSLGRNSGLFREKGGGGEGKEGREREGSGGEGEGHSQVERSLGQMSFYGLTGHQLLFWTVFLSI